ncbi:MAG: hypothetical protein GX200_09635 [Firmicutes bacterium]|nr:hypothetical protein [Bacillota bacterium]
MSNYGFKYAESICKTAFFGTKSPLATDYADVALLFANFRLAFLEPAVKPA